MATTYTQIGSTVTVGAGGASSINFSSIPSTYTDLKLILSTRINVSRTALFVRLNGSSSGYNYKSIWGYSSAVASYGGSGAAEWQIQYPGSTSDTANTFNSSELYIANYSSSAYKAASSDTVRENNASGSESAHQVMMAHLWQNTAAITSIAITVQTGNDFVQYSTASLYGIKNS
jgi:hypothetical protein